MSCENENEERSDNAQRRVTLLRLVASLLVSVVRSSLPSTPHSLFPSFLSLLSLTLTISLTINNRYTLRYTGAMVAEVNYILTKGKGVFCNVSSSKAKAKLRLLYECAPIALIIEEAGGSTVHEETKTSVLDVTIDHLDRRCGLCLGSSKEVDKFKRIVW